MEWPGTGATGGAHMRQAALSRVGGLNEVVHVLSGRRARGCWRSCTGVPGSLPAEGTTLDGDAGNCRPWRGRNIRDCARGCSYFANIPRKEEISDRCS